MFLTAFEMLKGVEKDDEERKFRVSWRGALRCTLALGNPNPGNTGKTPRLLGTPTFLSLRTPSLTKGAPIGHLRETRNE